MIPMIDKIDVIICSKDERNIRPSLMDTLRSARWCSQIIVETSKPLSYARVIGAQKASSPILLNVDDDVDLPKDLPVEKFVSYFDDPKVLAVSSQAYDMNKHWLAYRRALHFIWKDHDSIMDNFDNRVYLIRRETALAFPPVPYFYCEDTALAEWVQARGKWVNLPYCGINHYPHYQNLAYWGYYAKKGGLLKSRLQPWSNLLGHTGISFLSFLFTLDPRTLHFNLKQGIQKFAGYLMAVMDGF